MNTTQRQPRQRSQYLNLIIALALVGVLFFLMDVDTISSYSGGIGSTRALSLVTPTEIDGTTDSSSSWNTCPANKILPNLATAAPDSAVVRTYGDVPLIFMTTPKSGSTSITERLDETLGEHTALWLQKPDQAATLLQAWTVSVVFSVIRNPWTRFCSIYKMCKTDEHRIGTIETYPTFLETSKDPTVLEGHCHRSTSHWMPYTNHFLDQDDMNVYYDCMLRTEHLGEDWKDFRVHVNETIGVDVGELPGHITYGDSGLPHEISKEENLKTDYCHDYYEENPASVGYVNDFFHTDIDHFGYSYPYENSVEVA